MAGRRFLLLHVTTSSGHHHASRAIAHALRRLDPDCQIVNADAFDYVGRFARAGIMRSYLSLIRHYPDVWGYLYDNPAVHQRVQHLRALLHQYHTRKLQRLLETVQPHAIACTQAFPCGMLADFKKHRNLSTPLVGVLTDYAPHLYWVHDAVDAYVVPAAEVKTRFLEHGIPASRIHVYGIPIDPAFLDPLDRPQLYRKWQLDERLPVLLVMGGGSGFGPLQEVITHLDESQHPFQIVVLSGTNRSLQAWLRQHTFRHPVIAQGYVDDVHELMELATAIISKPGGLTTAEALAKHVPLLIATPIPGQEMCNTRFLLKHQAAVDITEMNRLGSLVDELLQNPTQLAQLRRCAQTLAQPRAAFDIAALLMRLADNPHSECLTSISSTN